MRTTSITAPRFVALLRAINVGGHTVKMDLLRSLFAELGFSNVETFIASGNVLFDGPATGDAALERQIEQHLQQALGYAVATFIRSTAELTAVATQQPFPTTELEVPGHSLYVAFLQAAPSAAAKQKLLALCSALNDFHIQGREIYWLCRTSMRDSAFSGAILEKTIGQPATLRSISTIKKLAAKYPPSV